MVVTIKSRSSPPSTLSANTMLYLHEQGSKTRPTKKTDVDNNVLHSKDLGHTRDFCMAVTTIPSTSVSLGFYWVFTVI